MSLCAIAACADAPASSSAGSIDEARRRKDAGVTVDARPVADAAASGSSTVACYSEGSPSAVCTLPVHCCFTDYSALHDGYCTTSACAWGTISCDGPEDCAAGELCCAHALVDTDGVVAGYAVACTAGACGGPPRDYELCHPSTGCSTGASCVTAYGNDYDLPPELDICR